MLYDPQIALYTFSIIIVSFVPTDYTVTEGVDGYAEMMLERRGFNNKSASVIVCTQSGTAIGMHK